MVNDLHAHILPPALVAALKLRDTPPRIVPRGGHWRLEMPVGSVPFGAGFHDLAQRLSALDAAGIRRQLLSLPGLFGVDSLPLAEAAPLCRAFNDGAAAAAAAHPDRFAWLAALPLADMDAALGELARARALGASGAIIAASAFRSEADARHRGLPLLEALEAHGGGHVFVHPGRWPGDAPPPETPYPDLAFARRQVDIQTEITEAAITLLYSPLLDGLPGLTVQVANLGGVLAMVIERIEEVVTGRGLDAPAPDFRAGRLLFDCASMGPRAIEIAARTFGAHTLALGTDMPIFDAAPRMAALRATELGADERATILGAGGFLWPQAHVPA